MMMQSKAARPLESAHAVALGFAPHSGWAAMVGITLAGGRPRVVVRENVRMAEDPEARQPYHTVEGLPAAQARTRLELFAADAGRRAHEALARVAGGLSDGQRRVAAIGILDSAGRKGGPLEAILASHARIHTADGEHFRDALAWAAEECGLPVLRVRARDLDAEASRQIGLSPPALRATLRKLGREMGPPWTADQKAAALLAWLVLARGSARGPAALSEP